MRFARTHSLAVLLGCILSGAPLHSAEEATPDPLDLDLRSWIQPAPASSRFSDPGYYVWCGTMVRDEQGIYHLFYSRWPLKLGFLQGPGRH